MTEPKMVKTYAARRRLKLGTEFRDGPRHLSDPVTVEHLVPEAHLFFRHESLLHTGMIQEVEVPVTDLFAAFRLREIPAADALEICDRLGLSADVEILGAHASPRVPAPRPARTRPQRELNPDRKGGPGTHRSRQRPVAPAKAPSKSAPVKSVATRVKAKKTTTSGKRAGTAVKIALREQVE